MQSRNSGCGIVGRVSIVSARSVGRRWLLVMASGLLAVLVGVGPVVAEEPGAKVGPNPDLYAKTVGGGIDFLVSHGQGPDGSFSKFAGTGPTSLAVTALLRSGRSADDPAVAKGLEYLRSSAHPDGGVYGMLGFFKNYETCAAIMCFQEAKAASDEKLLKQAETFIRGIQWDEDRDKDKSDISYGGVGYGGKSRPDLSNTAFLIDALKSCGAKADDPAIQKALVFASRCQNLETEYNTTKFASKVNDGGFYYTPIVDKQDEKRQTPNGGLRSYGSMSYSGLKSLIYAGVTQDDPRVKAAVGWIRKFYDVKNNPGMGDAGLYYYYHTFAKTLSVIGDDYVVDANGVKHDWRRELTEELASRQNPNGSWVNSNRRWMESDPNLATAFALLSLSYCRPADGK